MNIFNDNLRSGVMTILQNQALTTAQLSDAIGKLNKGQARLKALQLVLAVAGATVQL